MQEPYVLFGSVDSLGFLNGLGRRLARLRSTLADFFYPIKGRHVSIQAVFRRMRGLEDFSVKQPRTLISF